MFTAAGFGAFVILFLFFFQPFGIDKVNNGHINFIISIYGLITFGCIFITSIGFPLLWPRFFRESTWTTGKQIADTTVVLVLVGFVNYIISPVLVNSSFTWHSFVWFQGITLAIGILPITIHTLYKQNTLLHKFAQQAAALENKLKEKQTSGESAPVMQHITGADPGSITLTGDYHKEQIFVSSNQLYFISSADNYVKVFIEQSGKVSYSILRMTMKKAEESLESHSCFFRCHRAYIINLDKIVHVQGNAQGYKVQITGVEELIPVSRNLNNEFSDRLLATRRYTA